MNTRNSTLLVHISPGQSFNAKDIVTIDQAMIDHFADTTLDHQFIHVDPEKSKDTPFGCTIAHGFLSLSLLPHFLYKLDIIKPEDFTIINYGFDRLRYIQPVLVGSQLSAEFTIATIEQKPNGAVKLVLDSKVLIAGTEEAVLLLDWQLLLQAK